MHVVRDKNMAQPFEQHAFGAVIPAAGKGIRMEGDTPKVLLEINGRSVLQRVIDTFGNLGFVRDIVIAAPPGYCDRIREEIEYDHTRIVLRVIEGGDRRQDSVWFGFKELTPCDYVIVHDGARPFVRPEDIQSTASAAVEHGGAVLGVYPKATIKEYDTAGNILRTLDRGSLFEAQTPQIFEYGLFSRAFEHVRKHDIEVTDDAQMVEKAGGEVRAVSGAYTNIKITTPGDLAVCRVIAEGMLHDG